ncbi:MAG: hypothetical protein A2103_00455 [Gammaproteobacteria bacterium GWF2_41_13]|nr:MAG: hypothetical protein A2103_00455 [Gammaproteobacteria bacterium GWF2_41_13]
MYRSKQHRAKTIILDRDGVINEDSDAYIKSPEEWIPIPGSLEAIARLNKAGYQAFVISNQSGIGRKLFDIKTLETIHEKMNQQLALQGGRIEKIYFCPHKPEDNCDCRKPKIGLFKQLQKDYALSDLKNVYYIGDKYIDFLMAKKAHCPFIFVLTGHGHEEFKIHQDTFDIEKNLLIAKNLAQAVDFILGNK